MFCVNLSLYVCDLKTLPTSTHTHTETSSWLWSSPSPSPFPHCEWSANRMCSLLVFNSVKWKRIGIHNNLPEWHTQWRHAVMLPPPLPPGNVIIRLSRKDARQRVGRESESSLCVHLGLNVIRTPVVHVTKQMINNYLLENVPAVRVYWPYILLPPHRLISSCCCRPCCCCWPDLSPFHNAFGCSNCSSAFVDS